MSYDTNRAIPAQNAATAAAAIVAAELRAGETFGEGALERFEEVRTAIFNGTMALAGAEAVVEVFEGPQPAAAPQPTPVPAQNPAPAPAPAGGAGQQVFRFGKHSGKSVAQVGSDPENADYLDWARGNLDPAKNGELLADINAYLAAA